MGWCCCSYAIVDAFELVTNFCDSLKYGNGTFVITQLKGEPSQRSRTGAQRFLHVGIG